MHKLREYQRQSTDAVEKHIKKSVTACVIELATGAGKSLIVAELAQWLRDKAPQKKVLCLAPTKELVLQNHGKFLATGSHASILCASAGSKCWRAGVIFASPQSAKGVIEKIAHVGVSGIIIDEAHGITPTIMTLIESVLNYQINGDVINSNCRVIGMTATPYRLETGYIYSIDASGENDRLIDESESRKPYFNKLLFKVTAPELIEQGYLTPVTVGLSSSFYDTDNLKKDRFGKFSSASIKAAFDAQTKTESIAAEIVRVAESREGVMIFAATISHATEILSYLPPGSAMVSGNVSKKDRTTVINDFKSKKIKFIVNVDILTTGFDAPHVDLICVLRATESAGLFQQIIGRGLRLSPEKTDCLVLDYAQNIERHGLSSDIFTPKISAKKESGDSPEIDVTCPTCNILSAKKRRNDEAYQGLAHNDAGNFLCAGSEMATKWNEAGEPICWSGDELTTAIADPSVTDENGLSGVRIVPIPAHYSRKCNNPEHYMQNARAVACDHRYSSKQCPDCFAHNDIAARHCCECKERLVDPNEKLTLKSSSIKKAETQVVECLSATFCAHTSYANKKSIKCIFQTPTSPVTHYVTKKQHWLYNHMFWANGGGHMSDDYRECEKWDNAPNFIKIKKESGKLILLSVTYKES